MSLGSYIKSGRVEKGLTRQEFADLVGVNVNSVPKYEKAGKEGGQFPPFPVLCKIIVELELIPDIAIAMGLEDVGDVDKLVKDWRKPLDTMLEAYAVMAEAATKSDEAINLMRRKVREMVYMQGGISPGAKKKLNKTFGKGNYPIYDEDDLNTDKKNGPE